MDGTNKIADPWPVKLFLAVLQGTGSVKKRTYINFKVDIYQ